MTRVRRRSGPWSPVQVVVPFVFLAAVGVSALAGSPARGDSTPGVSVISIPLATSIHSSAGTWVTVPMGDLSQPLNTFWQLFFQPTGTTSWSNKVEATAVATNGGLVLASAANQPFVVGVRPSNLLHFSPLISTDDGGHSWSPGLLQEGLATSPSALSTGSTGQTLALVKDGLGAQVLTSTGGLSKWGTLTTARQLASGSGGKACGLDSLTAVASWAGSAIVGADCSRPGVVGIFAEQAGSFELSPIALSGSLRRGRVEVLALEQTTDGLMAVLGISENGETAVVAAWTTNTTRWTISPALVLASSHHLVSFGPADGSGLFVISASSSGSMRLAVVDDPGVPWRQLPPPPSNTATVAFSPTSPTIDAFAVRKSTMTVWALGSGSSDWVKGQVVHVPIEFGSSQ
jgi:hypothetical protein